MNSYWITLMITINDVEYYEECKVNAYNRVGAKYEAAKFVEDNFGNYSSYRITKIEQTDD